MDPQRQQTLWAIALENYQAAVLTAQQGWYNVSVACSYYALYTAMWVALGDPPKGRWEHRGIGKPFALGHWRTPPQPVERDTMKAIRRLYEHRLDADYRIVRLTAFESTAGTMTARTTLRLVAEAYGLAHGGYI